MYHKWTNLKCLFDMEQLSYAMWGIGLKRTMDKKFQKYIAVIEEYI